MIGSGEHSKFMNVKKGKRIMISSGDHSTFIKAYPYFPKINFISDKTNQELDANLKDDIYSKPASFVKKLQRKFKNR